MGHGNAAAAARRPTCQDTAWLGVVPCRLGGSQFRPQRRIQRDRQARGAVPMRYWTSQIVIGIVVSVVGTLITNTVSKGFSGRRHAAGESHYSGPARAG